MNLATWRTRKFREAQISPVQMSPAGGVFQARPKPALSPRCDFPNFGSASTFLRTICTCGTLSSSPLRTTTTTSAAAVLPRADQANCAAQTAMVGEGVWGPTKPRYPIIAVRQNGTTACLSIRSETAPDIVVSSFPSWLTSHALSQP